MPPGTYWPSCVSTSIYHHLDSVGISITHWKLLQELSLHSSVVELTPPRRSSKSPFPCESHVSICHNQSEVDCPNHQKSYFELPPPPPHRHVASRLTIPIHLRNCHQVALAVVTTLWLYLSCQIMHITQDFNLIPDNKVRGANMGPTWVLWAPCGTHVDPINA